jgi:non-ribosomal peptide synthetase component F
MLTAAEKRQLVVEWNATHLEYPRNKCLHELFAEQVRRTPDATAFVFDDRELTYAELNARAETLALKLRANQLAPDVLVGVCVERSLEMMIALLAIHKAGGAYLPLDPTYPRERIAFMLQDSQAPLLVTQLSLLPKLAAHQAAVICVDEAEAAGAPFARREKHRTGAGHVA